MERSGTRKVFGEFVQSGRGVVAEVRAGARKGGPAVAGPCPSSELVALASVFAPFVGRVEPHEVVVSVVVDHEEEAGDWVGNEWAMQPDRKVVDAFLRFLPGEAELAPKVGKDDEVGEFLLGHDLARDVAADRCDMTGVALVRGVVLKFTDNLTVRLDAHVGAFR